MSRNEQQLTDWIVTYDQNGMPGLVEGVTAADLEKSGGSQRVRIGDIFSLDLERLTLIDNGGNLWKLEGPGHQSIVIADVEPFNFIHVVDTDDEEDDDYES